MLIAFLLLAPASAGAGPAKGGIVDQRLESEHGVEVYGFGLDGIPGVAAEMGPLGLGASWSRVLVHWNRLQPLRPMPAGLDADADGYADAYLAELDAVVAALTSQGTTVIMTGTGVPRWARDSKYGSYHPDKAMRIGSTTVRTQFTALACFLATHFNGSVEHFECWNEPNIAHGISPQRARGKLVGLPVYVKMLAAFYRGIKQGQRGAVVIAGATAPRGTNNASSTSPQTFARYLKAHGAPKYFNAYSHHPYTPGGSRNAAPDQWPNNPDRCVTLKNLKVLLDVFPRTPFFLTEYGYNTQESSLFGLNVGAANQARYLRKAYEMVEKLDRVKALLWYLVVDWVPDPLTPKNAEYCGLVEADGLTRKPAWYAFAGGNLVLVTPPAPVAAGTPFSVTGTLTGKAPVGAGQPVALQRRAVASDPWTTVVSLQSGADGAFSFDGVQQSAANEYRVLWDGVAESGALTVPVVTP